MNRGIRKIFSVIVLGITLMIQNCIFVFDEYPHVVCNFDCTTIQGRFTTEDGKPIENVFLRLVWGSSPPSPKAFWGKSRKIMTGKTDENGDYKLSFYANDEELTEGSFSITFDLPDNSYIDYGFSYFQFHEVIKRDTTLFGNYHVAKKGANLALRIKNPEAISNADKLTSSAYFKFGQNKSISGGIGILSSTTQSQATFETAANQHTFINISKLKNGQYTYERDTIFIPMHETRTYEIEF